MHPPKFLYFDLGNVLVNFDHQLGARQMAEVAGISMEQVWKLVFEGDLLARFERGQISRQEFHDAFCQSTGSTALLDRLEHAGSSIFEMNHAMLPIVAKLEDAGQRLGILSNISESHWNYVQQHYSGIFPGAFDVLALSFQIGSTKPDRSIYVEAARLAGVSPGDIFYCDDIQANVDGALDAGFDAVLFTTAADYAQELAKRGVRFNY
ncbi:MAG: HAD family phosphatase [Planctomycetota bacterium]|nr:HAD family phosphatase [Planctomycetota bacterium]